jgi:glycosyltransferase involved in cell wall biosynthesis
MTSGVKFLSYPDHSGYGLAALAYVRALHNAGVPVWWAPLVVRGNRHVTWLPGDSLDELPVASEAASDAALQDVVALTRVAGPKTCDTVVFQTVPELWPMLAEPGKRNVGYTVWETDALPPHWLPLLNAQDRILVPCAMNRTLFEVAGVRKPVHVIPHIRRHGWNAISPADTAALRGQLGVPDDHFLFYTIGVWDPRKALPDLVSLFSHEFNADDKVSLVIKTSTRIHPLALDQGPAGGIVELARTIVDRAAAGTGRPAPHVVVVAADGVAGRAIDTLHATGDCFVSLTHGEGWGMGAFDAASIGKPVLITAYGGPAEYLGPGYPGLLDYTMLPVSGWSEEASFRLPQRWAQVDPVEAGRRMRRMVARHADFLDPAAIAAERILNRYAEPVVVRQLMAALDG